MDFYMWTFKIDNLFRGFNLTINYFYFKILFSIDQSSVSDSKLV
jgi:hypothetical protein